MLLFVGLGNPTPNSQDNRHNIGFKIVDAINLKFGLSKQKPKFKGLLTTGNIRETKVYAIKPLTFMNSSGICIKELIDYFEANVHKQKKGVSQGGVNSETKDSVDITINPKDILIPGNEIFKVYFEQLFECHQDYIAQWPFFT